LSEVASDVRMYVGGGADRMAGTHPEISRSRQEELTLPGAEAASILSAGAAHVSNGRQTAARPDE